MKQKMLIGAALLVGFFVIGAEWYLLARPLPQAGYPNAPQRTTSPSQKAPPLASTVTPTAITSTTPVIGMPTTTPSFITVNTPTSVTVTVQISPAAIPGGVNLFRLGVNGTQPTLLGVMHDDGTNDGIYSIQVSFDEYLTGQVLLEISAAFKGVLQRLVSAPFGIIVAPHAPPNFSVYNNSSIHLILIYPSTLQVSQQGSASIVLNDPSSLYSSPPYQITKLPALSPSLSLSTAISMAATTHLGADFAGIDSLFDNGALVNTNGSYPYDFFSYNPTTGAVFEILASPNLYMTATFNTIANSVDFY